LGSAAGESIGLGQPGPLLLLLIVFGLFAGKLQEFAIGCGAVLKLIPGILSVPFALSGNWRFLRILFWAAALSGIAALLMMGLAGPKKPKSINFVAGTPALSSWSVPSMVLRALDAPAPNQPLPENWIHANQLETLELPVRDRYAALGAGIAVLATGFVFLSRYRQDVFTSIGAVALALAAAPVCWSHYRVLQYAGVAILIARAWTTHKWLRLCAILLLAFCMYPGPVMILRHLYVVNSGWPNAPVLLYALTAIPTAADLCLVLLSSTFSERRVRPVA
jgi:hypothetical protein